MGRMAHLCTREIQIKHMTGTSGDGQFTYGPLETHKAYVEQKPTLVMARNGAQTPSHVYLLVETDIGEKDVLILPDGEEATILNVFPVYGFGTELLWTEVYA